MVADMAGAAKLMAALGITVLLTLCAGCTGSQLSADLASWHGSHIDEVSSAWGEPYTCEDLGAQQVCFWSHAGRGDSESNPETRLTGQVLRPRPSCIKMLAVDPSGYVTGWRWRGSRCPDSIAIARVE